MRRDALLLLLAGVAACHDPKQAELEARLARSEARLAQAEARLEELKPGLGEIMGVVQQHHTKLYYAGAAANWPLAAYQLDEIKEGLQSAGENHPHFKNLKPPLQELLGTMSASLARVQAAIAGKQQPEFLQAYAELTRSCNACHQAAEHAFIAVQPPRPGEFSDQRFEASPPPDAGP